MIEIQRNGNRPYSAWENPFEEGEISSPRLDTFRSLREYVSVLFWESPNSIKDGIEVVTDYYKAGLEGTDLLFNPIYREDNLPSGDGSDITLVPGFMGNELAYLLPRENLRRTGWAANVYSPRYGLHVGPTETEVDPLIKHLQDTRRLSGRKGHVIAHSKGGHVALLAAITRTEEFTDCVDQLILVGSPIPEKVNMQVGTVYLLAQLALKGNDFRLTAFAEDENSLARLNNVRLTTLKIKNDPIIEGLHLGSEAEIFEVASSHTGAIQNRNNLYFMVHRLARPLRSGHQLQEKFVPFPKAA